MLKMLKVLDQAREDNAETPEGAVPTLDALAREGTPKCGTGTAGGWWSATAVRSREPQRSPHFTIWINEGILIGQRYLALGSMGASN